MANIASAKKRARQSARRREQNMGQRSEMRTYVKRVVYAIEEGNTEAANAAYKTAVPYLDSMVNKGILHKNKAARYKSRLNSRIQAIA